MPQSAATQSAASLPPGPLISRRPPPLMEVVPCLLPPPSLISRLTRRQDPGVAFGSSRRRCLCGVCFSVCCPVRPRRYAWRGGVWVRGWTGKWYLPVLRGGGTAAAQMEADSEHSRRDSGGWTGEWWVSVVRGGGGLQLQERPSRTFCGAVLVYALGLSLTPLFPAPAYCWCCWPTETQLLCILTFLVVFVRNRAASRDRGFELRHSPEGEHGAGRDCGACGGSVDHFRGRGVGRRRGNGLAAGRTKDGTWWPAHVRFSSVVNFFLFVPFNVLRTLRKAMTGTSSDTVHYGALHKNAPTRSFCSRARRVHRHFLTGNAGSEKLHILRTGQSVSRICYCDPTGVTSDGVEDLTRIKGCSAAAHFTVSGQSISCKL